MKHTQYNKPDMTPELYEQIAVAVKLLRKGGVVAFPTETVYGLGADITIPSAVRRLFEVKGRPADHPLIVHFSNVSQLQYWAQEVPDSAWQLAKHFWPGPLTLILRRSHRIPQNVTGGQDTVGLRVPDHPIALALLETLGTTRALAAPSANRFGRVSPTTAIHVKEELGQAVSMILDGGACEVGLESTIVSFSNQTAVMLRPGGIPLTALEKVLNGQVILADNKKLTARTPGSLASHYAPSTPLEIHSAELIWRNAHIMAAQGLRVVVITWSVAHRTPPANKNILQFLMPQEPIAYGKQFYATLHRFDHVKFDRLLVEAPPSTPAWLAIADRLQRASHNTTNKIIK